MGCFLGFLHWLCYLADFSCLLYTSQPYGSRMVFVEARQHGRHWDMHFLVNVVCTNWLQMITANYFIIRLQNIKIVSWKYISKRWLLVSPFFFFFFFSPCQHFWYATLIARISAQTAKFHEPVTLDFLDAEIEDDIKVQVWKTHFSDSYNCRRSHQNQINCNTRLPNIWPGSKKTPIWPPGHLSNES